jgi:type IV pilus assembly protein PilM
MPIALKFKDVFSKEKYSLGLDCGTSTTKFIKLKFLKDNIQVCGFGSAPTQLDLEPVIKKLIASQEINRVNIAVSAPAAIIRYVNFPRMDREELRQALKFEAQKHIPFQISEVTIDGFILKSDLPDNKMLVLMSAVKKDFLSQRLKLMDASGLRTNIVDIDSLAVMNAFTHNYGQEELVKNKAVALLNIGAGFSNLSILEAGIPRLTRDIQIAGNGLTQKIADAFAVDFKTAEGIKIAPDTERMEKITAAGEFVISNLAREIRVSFDYYESQSAASVAKIYLSGAGSLFVGLREALAGLLGIEVEPWNPLQKIQIASTLDAEKVRASAISLAAAAGLALRG